MYQVTAQPMIWNTAKNATRVTAMATTTAMILVGILSQVIFFTTWVMMLVITVRIRAASRMTDTARGMIANFLGNVFNNPIAAVKVLFYDMCLTVIGYIRNLANAIETLINKIPGVTVDITSGLDNFYTGLEQAQQKVKDESGWVEYVQKMDFIDYSDAASAGYKFGEGIADKISGVFNLGGVEAFDLGNTFDGIYGNTGDIANNTAATADAFDITEEDLSYLRDIAEREAINRFTTAEIHVEQHNENHISKDADLDGIMDAWANDFAEKLDVSEEGVHE